jgi:amidohydrolase
MWHGICSQSPTRGVGNLLPQTFIEEAMQMVDRLTDWRRDFHRHPELGLDCHRTAGKVVENLRVLGWEVSQGWARTGVTAVLRPIGGAAGPAIGLRVDMDALPIQEATGAPYASATPGAAHACGHDGHLAIGLGVAEVLSRHRSHLSSPVKVIFQPGEEHPGGAKLMIEQGVLLDPPMGAMLGFHLYPELPSGHFGIRYGVMTAGCTDFTVVLRGKSGHAGYPHLAVDPVPALTSFVHAVLALNSRSHNPLAPLVITFGRISGGSAPNVIPEDVRLEGTMRALSDDVMAFALRRMQEILAGLRLTHGVEGELTAGESEPPLVCDERVTAFAEERLTEMWGPGRVRRLAEPSMGSEDFSRFAQLVPSTYVRIGTRDEEKGFIHPLHHPAFDFDEGVLALAVASLSYLLLSWTGR